MSSIGYHQIVPRDGIDAATDAAKISQSGGMALELLRIGAVSLLVLYHVASLTHAPSRASNFFLILAKSGYIGTDLLLALAGFLSVGSRARSQGTLDWVVCRFWRVFPTLAVFLVGYLYVIPFLLDLWGISPTAQPNYGDLDRARAVQWTLWTFTANFIMVNGQRVGAALEPLLTLGLGAQLTLLLALLLPSSRRVLLGTGCVALLGIVLRLLWLNADPYLPYSFPLSRGDGFLLGASFAILLRSPRARGTLLAWRHKLLLGSSVLLLAVMAASKGLPLTSPVTKLLGYPVISLWSAAVVLWLAQISRFPRRLQLFSRLGRGAYVAYLAKLPVCFVVGTWVSKTRGFEILHFATICLCATWLVGMVGYFLVERPWAGGRKA